MIKTIAFDADDTLWVNEPYFQETEKQCCALLEQFASHHQISLELLQTEVGNLHLYGYGVKGYILSMVEAALKLSGNTLPASAIEQMIQLGKTMLQKPVELIDGIEDVLQALQPYYRLVVATKGDLLDQERKLRLSGLESYFHHVEVMTDKQPADYEKLIRHLDVHPDSFMMIGNSLKSDVLPVLQIGGHAIHLPFHSTWAHENIDLHISHKKFRQFDSATAALPFLLQRKKAA